MTCAGFSQRDAREITGWSHFQVKKHMARLVELEYALVHGGGRGQLWKYELVYKGEGRHGGSFVMGLIDPDNLQDDGKREHQKGEWSPPGSPLVAPKSRGGSPLENAPEPLKQRALNGSAAKLTAGKEAAHA